MSTSENDQNEWHLQDASVEWLKEKSLNLFSIEKLINYPKIFNLRIIATLKKLE